MPGLFRILPFLRGRVEALLRPADPSFDPGRLSLCGRFHASYFAAERAAIVARNAAPNCDFARIESSGGFVNLTFGIGLLAAYLSEFTASLPAVGSFGSYVEGELFSPVLYAAARLNMFARRDAGPGNAALPCPEDAADALLSLYALAQWQDGPRLAAKARETAAALLALYEDIPRQTRRERIASLAPVADAGSRALLAAYNVLSGGKRP